MKKLKLKEDGEGKKRRTVKGSRGACKVKKRRDGKEKEGVQVKKGKETGMDPYSGMFDLLEAKGLLEKQGNRYKYMISTGEKTLESRETWTGDKLEMIMADLPAKEEQMVNIANADEEAVIDHNEELTENE